MSTKKTLLLIGIALFGFVFWKAWQSDSDRLDRIESDLANHNFPAYAREAVDSTYEVSAEISGDGVARLTETGPALTVGTMQSTFNLDAAQIIPRTLKAFPEVKQIELIREMTGTDKRGNEGKAKAIEMTFSRENAATINWDRVAFSDLPSIADHYWANPMLN